MTPIQNKQNQLAEQFHLKDIQIIKANYEANLKIKRWKFLMNIPGVGNRIREEATTDIQKNFLSYVNNTSILYEQGYYSYQVAN
jgi:hypothetical protein